MNYKKREIIEILHNLLIQTFKPSTVPEFPKYVFSDWLNNPYSRGSYAHLSPQKNSFDPVKALTMPIDGTIYFAGEHLMEDDSSGCVHGAYISGHRASTLMVEHYYYE